MLALACLRSACCGGVSRTAKSWQLPTSAFSIPLAALFFRSAYCEGLVETAGDVGFPLYYHFITIWAGVFLLLIGAWRLTGLSNNPPDWFLPYRITFFRLIAVVVLILLWWEASKRAGPNLFADPGSTLQAAIEMFGEDRNRLRVAFFDSLRHYSTGFTLASLAGIPIGLIFGGFRVLGRTMEVFMNALMATPRVAFIPLIIVFLGLGFDAKVFVIFLGAVMPIMVNTLCWRAPKRRRAGGNGALGRRSAQPGLHPHYASWSTAVHRGRASHRCHDRSDQHGCG